MIDSISSVSFKANDMQNLIGAPGQFPAVAQQPAVDSFVREGEEEEKSSNTGLKVLLGTAIASLAAFIGLGYAVKSGKLTKVEVPTEGALAKVMAHIKNFGVTVGEKAESCYKTIAGWLGRGEKAAEQVAEQTPSA